MFLEAAVDAVKKEGFKVRGADKVAKFEDSHKSVRPGGRKLGC